MALASVRKTVEFTVKKDLSDVFEQIDDEDLVEEAKRRGLEAEFKDEVMEALRDGEVAEEYKSRKLYLPDEGLGHVSDMLRELVKALNGGDTMHAGVLVDRMEWALKES